MLARIQSNWRHADTIKEWKEKTRQGQEVPPGEVAADSGGRGKVEVGEFYHPQLVARIPAKGFLIRRLID